MEYYYVLLCRCGSPISLTLISNSSYLSALKSYLPYPNLVQVETGILSRKTPVRPWPRIHYRISHSPRSYSPAFLKPTRSGYHTTYCQCTSREVNEARGPHTCSRPCAFKEKKNRKTHTHTHKSAPPKTHHEVHNSPATATTSRRRSTKHVPRDRPYSPASIDPGFVETGLVQLLQAVKTTNVARTHTDRLMK